ncbi:MAG: DMT family transporter [Candidatus Aminicenantes bacterium]|nr:DMT family transporter [Candidatus Aminicenantes bacterium]
MNPTEEYKKFGTTDILMIMVILFWALNFSFLKIVFREMAPLGFNGIRMLLASLVLILILLFKGENLKIERKDFWILVGLGVCGNTVFQLLFIHGLDLTTASNSSIIVALAPALIALLSSFLKHEKLHMLAWAGIVLSFVGFYLVISIKSGGVQFSRQSLQGDLLVFCGNIFWAIYTVFSKPMLNRISPLKFAALTMSFGTFFYLPFCVKDMMDISFEAISVRVWAILLYSAIFSLVIPYIVWYASVKRVGNSKTAIYDNLIPVLTILFAYMLLDERITPVQAVGTVVILAGVYLTRSGYHRFIKQERRKSQA